MMKMQCILVLFAGLLLAACTGKGTLSVSERENPTRKSNTAFKGFEDLTSPKFSALKEKYQLDTIFRGEQDEFRRQLMLRHWIRTVIHISDFEPAYPGKGFAENILDEALKGQGYHCGHYMIVQNAVMNAYGYVTRCLGAGPGVRGGPDGHHGVNEIWSNIFGKWYLSDAKYDHHFEKNGVPLSALEIRDEYLRNRVADVLLVKGPDRLSIETDGVANASGEMVAKTKVDFAQTYTWIEWESFNDRFTHWPENSDRLAVLNMFEDKYFRDNQWIWDGKPHWAYGTEFMKLISERDAIEWTPHIITSKVRTEEGVAYIELDSDTPNLKSYQMKRPSDRSWQDTPPALQVDIGSEREEVIFRTVNLAGVSGPEHRIVLKKEE